MNIYSFTLLIIAVVALAITLRVVLKATESYSIAERKITVERQNIAYILRRIYEKYAVFNAANPTDPIDETAKVEWDNLDHFTKNADIRKNDGDTGMAIITVKHIRVAHNTLSETATPLYRRWYEEEIQPLFEELSEAVTLYNQTIENDIELNPVLSRILSVTPDKLVKFDETTLEEAPHGATSK